ncbi:MAG: aminotransferase class V-fold PLP-dependent enzyme, partial [Acidiferrobacterales bacterium]|nr:aminotransferase class V-fold PLP-dependent enzyme [Acidiferrobacterales bacterium]
MQPFDKSESLFPIKQKYLYLSHCSIGPMYAPAAEAAKRFIDSHSHVGRALFADYSEALTSFRQKAAQWLRTSADNVAYVSNTSTGMNLIANGYPFEPGDQIVSYVHEFPANHYPWVLQQRRGVELVLLSDADPVGGLPAHGPRGWSMSELEQRVTPKTRIVAISQAQFSSGYAADLEALGRFCRDRNIDLVVDAAQSLGMLPLYPDAYGIAAMAASTWKWFLGPRGGGLLYTSSGFRAKLIPTMGGAGLMKHRYEYLNHTWDPIEDARRFEYSTLPWEHLLAIDKVLEDIFLKYPIEAIRDEVFRLHDQLLALLDHERFVPLQFPQRHRSGILAVRPQMDPLLLVEMAERQGV